MNNRYARARAARRNSTTSRRRIDKGRPATSPRSQAARRHSLAVVARSPRIYEADWPQSAELDLITEICPGYNLGKAYKRVIRAFELEFRSSELTSAQFALLVNIGRGEPATGTEVAERLGSDLSTVSRTIEAIVQRGYVTQERGTDRRVRVYRLTDAGRAALRDAIPLWERAKRNVLDDIDLRSWDDALRVLKRLAS